MTIDSPTPNDLAAYCWSIADLLRGDFKQSQYGRIILPFTLLRRLECVLEETKEQVLTEFEKVQKMNLPEGAQEKLLIRASGLSFYNTSKMDLSKLGQNGIKQNLESYIQSFSNDAREIFEYFNFAEFLGQLHDADLLIKIVQKVRTIDLSPKAPNNPNGISNHDMGLVFEELIRRFVEGSNETAGEHFTPSDIVRLTTSLVFMEDDDALTKPDVICTIYDPTVGTGGFLSSGMKYVHELNPQAVMRAFGQELNPESCAICKADMLIKGQDVTNIKLGNTLSNDQLYADKFDYMFSNPPFGVSWKKIESTIKNENTLNGFEGRFSPGLPRVSDGSLLFLMHLISKLRDTTEGGGRIGIILNGSPLFTGSAGSGESEIRRYILEADLLETIVALPIDMFYNTGIATYVWVLSNKKADERKGKVQLINGVNLCGKMRKSLGSKRNEMSSDDIATITKTFGAFEVVDATTFDKLGLKKTAEQKSNRGRQSDNLKQEAPKTIASKIFATHEFGYRRITIERPLRESYQFSDERIAELRFAPKSLNAPMKWLYETYGESWSDDADCENYGVLAEYEADILKHMKTHFSDVKEAKIKELLDPKTWAEQKQCLLKAKQLQAEIGTVQCDDMNDYETNIKVACKAQGISLDAREKKQISTAVSWKNPAAEKVIKKVHKNTEHNPLYGLFYVEGQTIQYKPDGDLRDNENVALDPSRSVNESNEAYFKKEVQPHVPDAWIDGSKTDAIDKEVGIVGYEINFKKVFYESKLDSWQSDNAELVRCKSVFSLYQEGEWGIDPITIKVVKVLPSNNRSLFRVNLDRSRINIDYFNYFISTEAGKDWVDSLKTGSIMSHVSSSRFMEARFPLPHLAHQRRIVELNHEYLSLLEKFRVMQSELLRDADGFEQQLEPHLNATQRFQDDYQHKLPHPLAILWNQSSLAFTEKEACENFCKFYEYLGVYLISIVLGFLKADDARKHLIKSNKPRSLNMGFSYNRLEEFSGSVPNDFPNGMKSIYSPILVDVLRRATNIRNDISHRGLPSGLEIKKKFRELESLNDKVQKFLRDFFDDYTLFRPISSTFNGQNFVYKIEVLDGLALNPSISREIITSKPLVDGKLYVGSLQDEEETKAYKLFPLISLEETIDESMFMGFYFYTDYVDEHLRYVCPYPNVATYKFKETNFWD